MSSTALFRQSPAAAVPLRWSAATLRQLVLLAATAGVVLALLGPFGGYATLGFWQRLGFWEPLLVLASVFHIAALWLSLRLLARWPLAEGFAVVPASLLASLPTALIASGLSVTVFGDASPPALPKLLGYVLTISLPMQMLSLLLVRRARPSGPAAESPVPHEPAAAATDQPAQSPSTVQATDAVATEPPLLLRLPARLGKDLQCLEMQDHYVKVHTRLGSIMLLMRMSDAEQEMQGLEGSRVHRSWWVAHRAVAKLTRQESRPTLLLQNGMQVPVSRERWAALRIQPWMIDLLK